MSWHNDTCPRFGRDDLGGRPGAVVVSVWCEHPDADRRERRTARFVVDVWADDMVYAAVLGFDDDDGAVVCETEDADLAARAFVCAVVGVRDALRGHEASPTRLGARGTGAPADSDRFHVDMPGAVV